MKQDEIIDMARQAGMYQDLNVSWNQSIQNFAKLVAAKERKACCADEILNSANIMANDMPHTVIEKYREAIRARGEA